MIRIKNDDGDDNSGSGDDSDNIELPSLFEWAFACVRSRVFSYNDDKFALIPIIDTCNHSNSNQCNAKLVPMSSSSAGKGGGG